MRKVSLTLLGLASSDFCILSSHRTPQRSRSKHIRDGCHAGAPLCNRKARIPARKWTGEQISDGVTGADQGKKSTRNVKPGGRVEERGPGKEALFICRLFHLPVICEQLVIESPTPTPRPPPVTERRGCDQAQNAGSKLRSSTDPADSPESVISLFSSWSVLTDVLDSRRDHWFVHTKRVFISELYSLPKFALISAVGKDLLNQSGLNTFFPLQTAFVVDEVSNIVKEAIESAIGGNAYQHSKVNQWTTNVVEQTLSQLTKLGKPFKYIVTCVIMQKNGAGLHTASSCFWDSSTDGSCTVRWENKTMYCIVSAFGLSI
ncbi:PREDICTED: dynein light chain Tctex-type 1 [Bison bison bison]|uniref:Dynein light chain Tctex-type 1 n=13 Tax=Boreoeutheria TaxID=1437010 RepID=A0A6P3HJA9_BISBB|nr:PREDICTED: dynein light chain Tctex-type 1 [Bison bison bison]